MGMPQRAPVKENDTEAFARFSTVCLQNSRKIRTFALKSGRTPPSLAKRGGLSVFSIGI